MWNVIILGIVSMLADMCSEMVYPLIPLYLASIGVGPAMLGVIEGAAEMVASLTKVVSGQVSDRTGRRKPLALAGYGLSALGKGVLALMGGWGLVLVGRLTDRFGKGIRNAPRDALLAESVAPQVRGHAFGLHRALDTAGALLGVLIAYGLVAQSPQRASVPYASVFMLAMVPGALSVVVLLMAREHPQVPTQPPILPAPRSYTPRALVVAWRHLDGQLRVFLLITLLFTLGNSSNQFLLLRAGQLGHTSGEVLLFYGGYQAIASICSYPAGWLSDRVGRRALLVAGYVAYGVAYLGFALAMNTLSLWVLFGFYGIYTACTEGVEKALLTDLAPPDLKATVLGFQATIVGLGLLPASVLAGGLWGWFGPGATFGFGSITGFLAAGALLFMLRSRTMRLSPPG